MWISVKIPCVSPEQQLDRAAGAAAALPSLGAASPTAQGSAAARRVPQTGSLHARLLRM